MIMEQMADSAVRTHTIWEQTVPSHFLWNYRAERAADGQSFPRHSSRHEQYLLLVPVPGRCEL